MTLTFSHLGSIWYHSEPLVVPFSQTSILTGTFFCHFLQQSSSIELVDIIDSSNIYFVIFFSFQMSLKLKQKWCQMTKR